MKISFLIVNHNMKGLTEQCCKSIMSQMELLKYEFEIIIADNSTNPDFALDLNLFQNKGKMRLIRLSENKGWINALNHLFKEARGEIIFVLHPDIEFLNGCVKTLLSFFENNPKAGAISPNMMYPNGVFNPIRLQFPTINSEMRRLFNIVTYSLFKRKFLIDEILWDRLCDTKTDMVMSVCLVLKRKALDVFQQIPGSLSMYYGNDWICLQIKRAGYQIHYVKDAMIIHHERFSTENSYSNEMHYKKTTIPVVDKMEKDKFTFLRSLYPSHVVFALKIVTSVEFFVHILASIKQSHSFQNKNSEKYIQALRIIWSTT